MKAHPRWWRQWGSIQQHIVWAVLVIGVSSLHAGTEPIVTTDLLRIRMVESIDVARDGSRVVVVVKSIGRVDQPSAGAQPMPEPQYVNQSHLFAVNLASRDAQLRQLTRGNRLDSGAQLSPDARHIAFLRTPDGADHAQVWMIAVDGGEPWQVTHMPNGADDVRWSPDGRRLLVSASVKLSELDGVPPWPLERPKRAWKDTPQTAARPDGTREEIRAWLDANAQHDNPFVINRIGFQDELSLRSEYLFRHLFMLELGDDLSARGEPKRITQGFWHHLDASFAPDGQSIVYSALKQTDVHPDRVLTRSLWRINIDGTNDREVLAMPGWRLERPRLSRDGTVLAFLGQQQDEPAFRQTEIGMATITAEGSADVAGAMWLTDDAVVPTSVVTFEWSGAATGILFNTERAGGVPLMMTGPGLIQPAEWVARDEHGSVGVWNFDAGGPVTVYSVTSPANPCTLRVRDGSGDRLLADLNPWVESKRISIPVESTLTRPDGVKVQYWVMEPTNREAGKKYPLAVEIHGGPSAMWGPGEDTMWIEFQLLCSWGYGVAYSNPRGSGGYGYEFQKGNFQNWGEGPANDVLAMTDQALLLDWVDPDRLVITGGSYAGYLTAWIIAHDHRFKAAVAQRGVYDLTTFFGEGNAWMLVNWAMGGWPFEARMKDIIERNSVFTYVRQIQTPLLIKHGSNDLRTGVSQSEMLYRALKELGRPVEYVRYPGAGHDMSRTGEPKQRLDRLNRIIEFFERHISNPRPAPVAREAWE